MKVLHLSVVPILLAVMVATGTGWAVEDAESATELEAAINLFRTAGPDQALPEFERLRIFYLDHGDSNNAATAERFIGASLWRLGDFPQSRQHLDQALKEARILGESLEEGKALNLLGLLEWDLGNYDQAISRFEMAGAIGSELGDNRLAGATSNNLGLVYDELGDYKTSLRKYQQALDLYLDADFPRGESDTLGNIGGVNLLLGRYQEAIGFYHRALAISEKLDSKASMTLDHGNLALCYLGLGQVNEALEHFGYALSLAVEAGMRKEQALWLRGKGNTLIRKGLYDQGLENHRAALAIYEEIDARGLLLDALQDMGSIHLSLGDPVSAEQYVLRGIEMAREVGLAQAVTTGLLALGDLHSRRGRLEEAAALYQQSLQRATDAGELNYQVESLLRLSLLHIQQQKLSDADTEARQALAIAVKTGAGFAITEAWYAIGESARYLGQLDVALESFELAQTAASQSIDPNILWQIHYSRARVQDELGMRQAAIAELQKSVRIIESIRERLHEDRFKAGFLQDKYQVYIDLVRLQLELGMTQAALTTAERLRARSFLDQLESAGPVYRDENERQEEIALRERVRQLQIALEEEWRLPAPDRRQLAVDVFSSELLAAERDYQAFLDDSRGRLANGQATTIPPLTEVQAQLAPGVAVVEYVIDQEQLMIFVLRSDSVSGLIEELRYVDLTSKVNLVRELIQDPGNEDWWVPAESLSNALIGPLETRGLLNGIRHLYLVPHGILNYLPFALLPVHLDAGERVLIEQYSLTYLPAAVTLVGVREDNGTLKSLLAMAPAKSRLQYALEEAEQISGMYIGSRLLTGDDATETAFRKQAGEYGVLHLSTHGIFNMKNPLLSGLELEADDRNDGFLEVHEILGLSLHASLVTLSACDTGMGSGYFNEIPAGDEFVSLTRAFLLAGSEAVLAALWPVDDRSTVELMAGFYRNLAAPDGGQGQAVALAKIQRTFRNSRHYRHPFYWAPFVLVGRHGSHSGAPI